MKRGGIRSRRLLLSAVLWAPAALLAAPSCTEPRRTQHDAPCSFPAASCDGRCVDLSTDPEHCGACGEPCPDGMMCVGGACEDAASNTPPRCGPGLTDCGGTCADTRISPDHCGGCDAPCEAGRACEGGACQTSCREGFSACGDECVDLKNDPQHCGRCGRACDPGRGCDGGRCECSVHPSLDIGSTVPQRVEGSTAGASDSRTLACAGPGAVDQTFLFTAPVKGTYLFDTFEADHDTALGVIRPETCDLLACNDDASGMKSSQVSVPLDKGEQLLVVVSGARGEQGTFTLRVTESGSVQCSPTALDPALPLVVPGTTVGFDDSVRSRCSLGWTPDATYTFTAPRAGLFVFSASGPGARAINLLDGGTCTGAPIACALNPGDRAQVVAELDAGQTVLVSVEGAKDHTGAFTLEVVEAPPCPLLDLGDEVPQTVTGSNEGVEGVLSACGADATGGEVTYRFTAPADGLYTLDARASTIPVLLDVRDGMCTGGSLGCADGSPGEPARLTLPLTAGQSVVAVVDTTGGTGEHVLEISEARCPLADLGAEAPWSVTGSTAELEDMLAPSCGASKGAEATYGFTAPADALYVFDTAGSTLDTVLEVRDGACTGRPLRCHDGALGAASRVSVVLSAGQKVIAIVDSDGGEGDYVLNVTQHEIPACPRELLGIDLPQTVTGNNTGYLDRLASRCGGGAGGEATYGFTAPKDGYFIFDTTGSTVETILSVREGGCEGAEIVCNRNGTSSKAVLSLSAGETVLISVDTMGPEGDYQLKVSEFEGEGTCRTPIVIKPVTTPQTYTGTITTRPAEVVPSCGYLEKSPDVVYTFTAPVAGEYTFDTSGSTFDTVLAVFEGSCAGMELVCNDDAPDLGFQSQVTMTLEAGQTVAVVVDGFGMSSGDYTLHVRGN